MQSCVERRKIRHACFGCIVILIDVSMLYCMLEGAAMHCATPRRQKQECVPAVVFPTRLTFV